MGAMAANPDEHIPDSEETPRLAIVDLDWDKIRAVDILAVLRSFLAKGQSIKAVTVYPSDFGLEKMKEEAAIGPQVSTACSLAVEHAGVSCSLTLLVPASRTDAGVEPMLRGSVALSCKAVCYLGPAPCIDSLCCADFH